MEVERVDMVKVSATPEILDTGKAPVWKTCEPNYAQRL